MESRLKPYEEYKDTELLWLDSVPKHWQVKLNKSLWDERKITNCIDEQLFSVTIKKGVISQSELLESSSKKDLSNLDKSKYKLVKPNDVAYNKMRMWQGAVGVSKYRGIVSPAYIVLKPRSDMNHRYYHYLLRTPEYIEEAHRHSYGICDDQLSLRYEDFKRMQNIVPPKKEQDQIVHYLDSKLLKINKFIKAKRKLVELLQEQKQAIINQAVTKGLDPNAKMKPSGIEWLGDIPDGWETVKIKFLSNKPLMYGANESGIAFSSDLPRYIRITDICLDGSLKDNNKLSLDRDVAKSYILEDGDILFARSGATVGKTFLYEDEYGECCFAGYMIKFSPNLKLIIPEFLYYFTLSGCYNVNPQIQCSRMGSFFSN